MSDNAKTDDEVLRHCKRSGPEGDVHLEITNELLEHGSTAGCGWNRAQVECLGVQWPLTSGWKNTVIGRRFPRAVIERFLALRTPAKSHEEEAHVEETAPPSTEKKRYKPGFMPESLRDQCWEIARMVEWTTEDWCDFHDSLTMLFARISMRHAEARLAKEQEARHQRHETPLGDQ